MGACFIVEMGFLWANSINALEVDGGIRREQACALVNTRHQRDPCLDHVADGGLGDLVVFDGGSAFEFSSNVVAMLSHQQGLVEVFSV